MSFFTNFINKFAGRTIFIPGGGTRSYPKNILLEEQDICASIVDCNATHVSRGQALHIIEDKEGRVKQIKRNSVYSKLFSNPNPMMSRQDFMYAMAWNLQISNTALAWIKWDGGMKPVEIWPLVYLNFEVYEANGSYAVKIYDPDGQMYTVMMEDLVCIRRKYDGRGYSGRSNRQISGTLDLVSSLDESLSEAITVSNKIHGILKSKNAMFVTTPQDKKSLSLAERIKDAAVTGSLILDATEDYTPVSLSTWSANYKQAEQVYDRIYTFFRTPVEVVKNTASEQIMQNFYDSVIEPIWEEIGEALTTAMFTTGEKNAGNRIKVYSNAATGASWQTKLNIVTNTKDVGFLTKNEYRELLGYAPTDDGDESYVSLNYVKASDQSKYQTGTDTTTQAEGGDQNAGNQ